MRHKAFWHPGCARALAGCNVGATRAVVEESNVEKSRARFSRLE